MNNYEYNQFDDINKIERSLLSLSQIKKDEITSGVQWSDNVFKPSYSSLSRYWNSIDHTQMFEGYKDILAKLKGVNEMCKFSPLSLKEKKYVVTRLEKLNDLILSGIDKGVGSIVSYYKDVSDSMISDKEEFLAIRESAIVAETLSFKKTVVSVIEYIESNFLNPNYTPVKMVVEDDWSSLLKSQFHKQFTINFPSVDENCLAGHSLSYPQNYRAILQDKNPRAILQLGECFLKPEDKDSLYFDAISLALSEDNIEQRADLELAINLANEMPEGDLASAAKTKILNYASSNGIDNIDGTSIREKLGFTSYYEMAKQFLEDGNVLAAKLFAGQFLEGEEQEEIYLLCAQEDSTDDIIDSL